MSTNPKFLIRQDDEDQQYVVSYDDAAGNVEEFARQTPGTDGDRFLWVIRAAAQMHGMDVELTPTNEDDETGATV